VPTADGPGLPPIPDEELALVLSGHEGRNVEFKGPGNPKDTAFLAKVAKAAIAMSNLRDGGTILVGLDDTDAATGGPGLSAEDSGLWLDYDLVSDRLASYCDPPVEFRVSLHASHTGATVARIRVQQFEDVPTLCKKEFTGVITRGRLYIRTKGKPETADAFSSNELRELLDLAGEKRAREILAQQARVATGIAAQAAIEDGAV
jgi:predicted HTH transcriptional regulator